MRRRRDETRAYMNSAGTGVYTALHRIAWHCIALHYTRLHELGVRGVYMTLHYNYFTSACMNSAGTSIGARNLATYARFFSAGSLAGAAGGGGGAS